MMNQKSNSKTQFMRWIWFAAALAFGALGLGLIMFNVQFSSNGAINSLAFSLLALGTTVFAILLIPQAYSLAIRGRDFELYRIVFPHSDSH